MIENSRYADLAYLAQSIATRLAQDCTDYAETVTIYRKRQADLDAIANTLKHAKPRRKIAAAAQGDHV
jgi:hypothetical protein